MLIDPYKRPVNYLRVSVTDRCDFRCQYCMAENMKFLPKKDLLTLDEIERICISFIDLGTKKIRITGGEPLVRKNVMSLFKNLGSYIKKEQLSELTLTFLLTNQALPEWSGFVNNCTAPFSSGKIIYLVLSIFKELI